MAEKTMQNVTMRVRIGENELEVTGPTDFVEKKVAEFLEQRKQQPTGRHPSDATTGSTARRTPIDPGTKQLSPAQFFKKVSARTDIDRVLAAGFYLERFKSQENFITAEITQLIRSAKTPPPTNPSDSIAKNIKKGLMMAAGDKDGKMAFVLTSDGEEAISLLLQQ